MSYTHDARPREPWNKGKLIGQKLPLKPHEVWSIWVRLDMAHEVRDLALFNLAIDSKLRGCDLVKLMVRDVARGTVILSRTKVILLNDEPVALDLPPTVELEIEETDPPVKAGSAAAPTKPAKLSTGLIGDSGARAHFHRR